MRQGYVVIPLWLGVALSSSAADPHREVEKQKAACRAGNPKACEKVVAIARSSPSSLAREKALEVVEDQSLLALIAKADPDADVRTAALKKVTDGAVLREAAKSGKDRKEREVAIQSPRLTDLPLLQEIAASDPDPINRRSAASRTRKIVETSTDQAMLAQVAIAGDKDGLDVLAAKRLTDPDFLMDVARGSRSSSARLAAVGNPAFGDQKTLFELATNAEDAILRVRAGEALKDQPLLAELAKTAKDVNVRLAAVGNLQDQAVLAEIALGSSDPKLQSAAAKRVTDPAALARLARESSDVSLRKSTVTKLTDAKVLAAIAKDDKDPEVRRLARLTIASVSADPVALARMARTDTDAGVRTAAVQNPKLSDPAVLASIAKTEQDFTVAVAALDRLGDGPSLRALAVPGVSGRIQALARLRLVTSHACFRDHYGTVSTQVSTRWNERQYGNPGASYGIKSISVEAVTIALSGAKPALPTLYYSGTAEQTETFSSFEYHKTRAASFGFGQIWGDLKPRLEPNVMACLAGEASLAFLPK